MSELLTDVRRERPYPELSALHERLLGEAFRRYVTLGRGHALGVEALAHVAGCPDGFVRDATDRLKLLHTDRNGLVRPSLIGLVQLEVPEALALWRELDAVVRAVHARYQPERPQVPVKEVLEGAGVDPARFELLRPYLEDAGLQLVDGADLGNFSVYPAVLAPDGLPEVVARFARSARERPRHLDPAVLDAPGPFELRWTGVEVERFRALRDLRLDFPSRLTVLVGVNGAGKSTALDVGAFVANALLEGLPDALAAENGFARLRSRGASGPIAVRVRFEADLGMGPEPGQYAFVVDERYGQVQVEQETLTMGVGAAQVTWLDRRRAVGNVWRPAQKQPERVYPALDDLYLGQLDDRTIHPIPCGLGQDLGRVLLVDRDPEFAKAEEGVEIILAGDERRVTRPRARWSATIEALLDDAVPDQAAADRLASVLAELVPTVRAVRRVAVTGAHARFEVVEVDSPEAARLDELSAGMRQMLLLAAAYIHPEPPSLLLLEEPDAGIHVGAFQALRDLLRSIARRTTVVATSHSPLFVGLLDPEREVVVLDRDERGVHAKSLAEARRSRRWLASFEEPGESFVRLGMEKKP